MANYWIAQERGTLVPQTAVSDAQAYRVRFVSARDQAFVSGYAGYGEQQGLYCVYDSTGKFKSAITANTDNAGYTEVYRDIAINSTHAFNIGYTTAASSVDWVITKYDFTGALVASGLYTSSSGANDDYAFGCVADDTYLYVVGFISSGGQKATFTKYDVATLTPQLGRQMTPPLGNCRWLSVAKYGENLYMAGYNGGDLTGIIAKYATSGNLQWQKFASSTVVQFFDVATNSDGSAIYAVGWENDGTRVGGVIVKFDDSGNVVWSKKLYNTTSSREIQFRGVTVDSSGNIYVCGHATNSSTTRDGYLVKYNSSGTLQWQRRVYDVTYYSSSDTVLNGVSVDNLGGVYATGLIYNPESAMITLKVADDGTGTGAYSNVYYNGSTYGTEQTGTISISDGVLTNGTRTLIQSSTSLLSAPNYTYTENV